MIFDLHQGKETILNPKTIRKTERFAKEKTFTPFFMIELQKQGKNHIIFLYKFVIFYN